MFFCNALVLTSKNGSFAQGSQEKTQNCEILASIPPVTAYAVPSPLYTRRALAYRKFGDFTIFTEDISKYLITTP